MRPEERAGSRQETEFDCASKLDRYIGLSLFLGCSIPHFPGQLQPELMDQRSIGSILFWPGTRKSPATQANVIFHVGLRFEVHQHP